MKNRALQMRQDNIILAHLQCAITFYRLTRRFTSGYFLFAARAAGQKVFLRILAFSQKILIKRARLRKPASGSSAAGF
jgi:hypothetical protein